MLTPTHVGFSRSTSKDIIVDHNQTRLLAKLLEEKNGLLGEPVRAISSMRDFSDWSYRVDWRVPKDLFGKMMSHFGDRAADVIQKEIKSNFYYYYGDDVNTDWDESMGGHLDLLMNYPRSVAKAVPFIVREAIEPLYSLALGDTVWEFHARRLDAALVKALLMHFAAPVKVSLGEDHRQILKVINHWRMELVDQWDEVCINRGDLMANGGAPCPVFRQSSTLLSRWCRRATAEMMAHKVAGHHLSQELVNMISDYCYDKKRVALSYTELKRPRQSYFLADKNGDCLEWPEEGEEEGDVD